MLKQQGISKINIHPLRRKRVLILGTPFFKGINQCVALPENIIGFFSLL
jgi:hypothetical protein